LDNTPGPENNSGLKPAVMIASALTDNYASFGLKCWLCELLSQISDSTKEASVTLFLGGCQKPDLLPWGSLVDAHIHRFKLENPHYWPWTK